MVLEKLKNQLFETLEYNELNITGKNMYSCAFENYINFIDTLEHIEKKEINNKVNETKMSDDFHIEDLVKKFSKINVC